MLGLVDRDRAGGLLVVEFGDALLADRDGAAYGASADTGFLGQLLGGAAGVRDRFVPIGDKRFLVATGCCLTLARLTLLELLHCCNRMSELLLGRRLEAVRWVYGLYLATGVSHASDAAFSGHLCRLRRTGFLRYRCCRLRPQVWLHLCRHPRTGRRLAYAAPHHIIHRKGTLLRRAFSRCRWRRRRNVLHFQGDGR